MTMRSLPFVFAAVCLGLVVSVPKARAQEANECDKAIDELREGTEAYTANDLQRAKQHLTRSMELQASPAAARYLAFTYEALGQLLEAAKAYRKAGDLAVPACGKKATRDAQEKAKTSAQAELKALEERIPGIALQLHKTGTAAAAVLLDGAPLGLEALSNSIQVDPGEHHLVARCGAKEVRADVRLAESEHKTVQLTIDCSVHTALKVRLDTIGGGPITLLLDGTPLELESLGSPVEVKPGRHRLVALCGKEKVAEFGPLDLAEGETKDAAFTVRCPRPGSVTVRLEGAEAEAVAVLLDGSALFADSLGQRVAVAPGRHLVSARCTNGKASMETPVAVAEGEGKDVRLAVDCSEPEWWESSTVGWAGVGVGIAGVTLGTVASVWAAQKHSDLKDRGCSETKCPTAFSDDVHTLDYLRYGSTAAFIVGGLGLAGGVWILAHPERPAEAGSAEAVRLEVGPGAAQLRGSF